MTTASARFPLVSPAGELDIGQGRKDFVQWVRDLTEAFHVRIEKELAQAPWVENSQNGKNRTLRQPLG
jgi:hypothetical protein